MASLPGDANDRIQQAVETAMQQSGSTQALIGVWTADSGEYVQGLTTDDSELPVTTSFRGAQTTQPYTCALLLELVAQGVVSLDREVSKDLPRQNGIEGITYRQLCEQTSGLADYKAAFSGINRNNPARFWPDRELISQGLVNSPLPHAGLNFNYSDTNAVVLGRALKIVADRELPDLLDDEIFQPTQMTRTELPTGTTLPDPTLAPLVFPVADGKAVCDTAIELAEVSPSMLSGAGGAVTTLSDHRAFLDAYLSGKIGGAQAAEVLAEERSTLNPERNAEGEVTKEAEASGQAWGFGLLHEGPLKGRDGLITGTISAAFQDPNTGFTVVVALNNSSAGGGFAKQLAFQLAAIVSEAQPDAVGELPWTVETTAEALAAAAVC
ncbi:serine hydrolase domain-containing protein [Leucobacter sp. M11]|uniref:serine hydrolase domain-containing protein n=1 Tax=Leucobacter sp. M11 TaxID=2993565 RepID=UPI002D7FC404|nr:serine hydrolase domain-containing protein [Leucobacter sp. M11]MEB4614834.1 serine hydrolase [Leucobacter sp. M11]